jgi:hypothetical protein
VGCFLGVSFGFSLCGLVGFLCGLALVVPLYSPCVLGASYAFILMKLSLLIKKKKKKLIIYLFLLCL